MKAIFRAVIVATLLVVYQTADIPNCNFDDTVDLTDAHIFPNGSYLYAQRALITPDLVGIYDYELLSNGTRLPLPPHTRGCLCVNNDCVRFCCDPYKGTAKLNNTRDCSMSGPNEFLQYDSYVNVLLANGSRVRKHATKEFIAVTGAFCELNKTYMLTPEINKVHAWDFDERGNLIFHKVNMKFSKHHYCLTTTPIDGDKFVLNPAICPISRQITLTERLTYTFMAATIPFIVLTLLVYIFVPELQNIHGKCFMCYLTALAAAFTILSVQNLSNNSFISTKWCNFLGYLTYFFLMSVFFWLNTISFDLWQSFRRTAPVHSGQSKRFVYYLLYGWGVPLSLTALVMVLQNSNISKAYHPGIGYDTCGVKTTDWSAMIYYFGINLIIVVADMIFFVMTFYKILTMKKDINRLMKSSDSNKSKKMNDDKTNFGLFVRLFLIMGVTWLSDVLNYIIIQIYPGYNSPLFVISDIMNIAVGPYIFICYVLNRKVLGLIKQRIKNLRTGGNTREGETTISLTDNQTSNSSRRN